MSVRQGMMNCVWKNSEFKGFARGGTMVRMIRTEFENDVLIGFDSDNIDRSVL